MPASLIVMAAGMGSRFGEEIKQLSPIGENQETLIDYSVYDAIDAGFNKIIFVIRQDFEKVFLDRVMNRMKKAYRQKNIQFEYVFQRIESTPIGLVPNRIKPWGTCQAVLAAKDVINEPFGVINADDYYGKEAFQKLFQFLTSKDDIDECCMVGFKLINTILEGAIVTRGLCEHINNNVERIVETKNIQRIKEQIFTGDKILDGNTYVSMNMWGFDKSFLEKLEISFSNFLNNISKEDMLTAEFLLPVYINELIQNKRITVKMLKSDDVCIGMTHSKDKQAVVQHFKKLIKKNIYKRNLYE